MQSDYKNLIKYLLTFVFCFSFLTATLVAETSSNNVIDTSPSHVAEIKNNLDSLEFVLPQSSRQQTNQNRFLYTFPRRIISNQELSVISFFQETNYILDANTELEVLIAKNQEKRIHLNLISGSVIIDNRLANESIQTIQVGNTFLKPFTNGIYLLTKDGSNITLGSIQGSFSLGVYDSTGQLSNTYLIHRFQEVNYDSVLSPQNFKTNPLASRAYLDRFRFSNISSINEDLSKSRLFKLNFKGKVYTPTQSQGFFASLNALNFNQNKENFLNIYPFYRALEQAKQDILKNNSANLSEFLVQARETYLKIISEDPNTINLFNQTANQNINLMVGLSPESNLNALKIFLADLFSSQLDQSTSLKLALSLLEDINYGYDNRKPDIAVRSEQVLVKSVNAPALLQNELSDLTNLLIVIDNILETYDTAYSLEIFQARESVIKSITSKTQDPQILNQIQARKLNYFQRVLSLGQERKIDIPKAKRIAFYIADSLPEDLQQQYRNQINQLD